MQLVQQVSPVSAGLLAALIPVFEPVGWRSAGPGTILGYALTPAAAAWIVASGVLSLVSTVSFYLFVGATSSLTYNVVGHLHTVLFMASGAALFGDETGATTLLGLVVAMAGIVWYTHIKLEEARKPMPTDRRGSI
jgi:solute carrier family 35 protein E3